MQRMWEMNKRSKSPASEHKMPPSPDFVRVQNTKSAKPSVENEPPQPEPQPKNTTSPQGVSAIFDSLSLPFLGNLKNDSDMTLILGLLLILWSEKSDQLLLIALLYILI